jgi:hypothetical protein
MFLIHFTKKDRISNFAKIRLVGAELFHADGRTDITKLIVAFRNFVNAPKKISFENLGGSAFNIQTCSYHASTWLGG